MYVKIGALFVSAVCFLSMTAHSSADDHCPKRIAVLDGSLVAEQDVAPRLSKLYRELGCETEFVRLPARRAMKAFNDGEVDGELFRLQVAERHYTRAFTRSEVPVRAMINAVWAHPDPSVRKARPIGYMLGIVWHEEYAKTHRGIGYKDMDQMFLAFRRGDLGGFLGSQWSTESRIKGGFFPVEPQLETVFSQHPVYHYLQVQYQPFMMRLSNLLRVRMMSIRHEG